MTVPSKPVQYNWYLRIESIILDMENKINWVCIVTTLNLFEVGTVSMPVCTDVKYLYSYLAEYLGE